MMNNVFFKKDFIIKLILLSFIFILIFPMVLLIFWLLCLVFFIFLFRRNTVTYKDTLSNAADIILSPLSGRIVEIFKDDNNHQLIKMTIPFIGPYGLYVPFSSEVLQSVEMKGEKMWRGEKVATLMEKSERFLIEFQNKLGHKTAVEIMSCILSGKPRIWIKTGDKGRSAACFGYLPFGGSVVLRLPENSKILVEVGENIRAGYTVLSGTKG